MSSPFLSIVIPAYNEEKRLPGTLRDIEDKMIDYRFPYEVLIVSDGSKDKTVEIVKNFSTNIKELHVIENKENHGKGFVTKQGMLTAKGSWRLFMDADNSTTMLEFKKFIPFLEGEYDVIIASRGISGAKLLPPQPWYRRIPGKIGNLIIQTLVLPGIRDTQCGFKCFSNRAAEKIFPKMKIEKWGFDVEALALAKHFGFKIKEIPVVWINDTRSTVKASAFISTLIDVIKIRMNLWMGVYEK